LNVSTAHRRTRSGWVERTLVDINQAMEQAVFAEKLARRPGLLQYIDARVKVIALLLLLLAVNLSHSLGVIAGLYTIALFLALLSHVPFWGYLKRTWVFTMIFTGIIALPALLITPGPAWVHLPLGMTITQTGGRTALFLLFRAGASVAMAVLFILTTPWNSMLKALGVLHVPDVVVLVLGMTYRYIHLLLHTANDMYLSRRSRILKLMTGTEERHLAAATTGTLLAKSLQVSSDVYLAMESQGFRGYPRTLDAFRMRWSDWGFAVVMILVSAAAIWLGR
jgi:cobalt ECF transporter T component CbiQ